MTSPKKILWTANIPLPAVAEQLGLPASPFGGWLTLMTRELAKDNRFKVAVAMRCPISNFQVIEKDNITYYAIPQAKADQYDVEQSVCDRVLNHFKPDLLHCEGAEMRYTRRFLETWQGERLLSMQGVINGYTQYELGRLPLLGMLNPFHPKVALTAVALIVNKLWRFNSRLNHERAAMQCATHLMGRTEWDQAQAFAINPAASYHSCSRILRDTFYQTQWQLEQAKRFTLFVGNAGSPRKGVHVLLQAVAQLKQHFPEIRVRIAGENPHTKGSAVKRMIGYGSYINHLIHTLKLDKNVEFLGVLQEQDMAKQLASSHVYVMSSIIENSPNTLGEAMIMGVPCVTAFAGGTPTMATDEQEALFYRADDPAMLALKLKRIFESDELACRLSQHARKKAMHTHNPERNVKALVDTYLSITASAEQTTTTDQQEV